jgi:DNA-binding XRE family transcriptional regulator
MSRAPQRVPLRELRDRRALSLSELADLAGVDRKTIHRIEHGQQMPHPSTRRKLAKALRVNVDRIAWRAG